MLVSVEDLIGFLQETEHKRRNIVSIGQETSASQASALMSKEDINLLVVVNPEGRPVGIVTSSDTSRVFGSSSARPSERMVMEFMTPKSEVVTVGLHTLLAEVPPLFKSPETKRHLIVTDDDGRWHAIIDSNEVMMGMAKNAEEIENLRKYSESETR